MGVNLRKLVAMFRVARAGAPLGDVAVLKIDALDVPSGIVGKLIAPTPQHDLDTLRCLPASLLGGAYARFLDANHIEPLVVTDATKERVRENPYAMRYTATHDLHHVVTGFDTGLAGEVGVLAFTIGQGSAPMGRALFRFVVLLFSLLSPFQAARIRRNARLGVAMGRRAALVIAEPLESWFQRPLVDVREELGIAARDIRDIAASSSSWVGDIVFPIKQAR
jgi:ubiquinone biosynthesis protein Coq4